RRWFSSSALPGPPGWTGSSTAEACSSRKRPPGRPSGPPGSRGWRWGRGPTSRKTGARPSRSLGARSLGDRARHFERVRERLDGVAIRDGQPRPIDARHVGVEAGRGLERHGDAGDQQAGIRTLGCVDDLPLEVEDRVLSIMYAAVLAGWALPISYDGGRQY